MKKPLNFEALFSEAEALYRRGSVLGTVQILLWIAKVHPEWAAWSRSYLLGVIIDLNNMFKTDPSRNAASQMRRVNRVYAELIKWANERYSQPPTSSSIATIHKEVGRVESTLRSAKLLDRLPPLRPVDAPSRQEVAERLAEKPVRRAAASPPRRTKPAKRAGSPERARPRGKSSAKSVERNRGVSSEKRHATFSGVDFTGPDSRVIRARAPIERIPHMDIEYEGAQLAPTMAAKVRIYVDKEAARPGESGVPVVVEGEADVQVRLLTTDHFVIEGANTRTIHLAPELDKSEADAFSIQVKPAAQLPADAEPILTAVFFNDGRPCGKVARSVEIAGYRIAAPTEPPPPEPVPPVTPEAAVHVVEAKPADLSITITRLDDTGMNFNCTVQTTLLPDYAEGQDEKWQFPQRTDLIVRAYMDQFTKKKSANAIIAELKGAGQKFFEFAPKIFKDAFWALIDSKREFNTIAIVSEEPFIPWELMIPKREGQLRPALGVECCVARWTFRKNVVAAPQAIHLSDCYVIAPQYQDKKKDLKSAVAEKTFVLSQFTGDPIDPATFTQVEQRLEQDTRSLIHFVCHGKADAAGIQVLDLEDDSMSSNAVIGMDGVAAAFARKHPFVFINACEVGRAAPALVGVGGFADSFIQIGASAVIAPLWSVDDKIAFEVAKEFYTRAKAQPQSSFAEILRDIRAKAYANDGAKDTYAAYCLYGDPAAMRVE